MALDTNLTPEIVNSFNVYIDGVKAIGTAPEITLPQITSETIDVSGSGILGKISAPNIGQFESIEQEVSFNLVYSSFVNVLSPKRQVNLTFRVAQQAVDKSLTLPGRWMKKRSNAVLPVLRGCWNTRRVRVYGGG